MTQALPTLSAAPGSPPTARPETLTELFFAQTWLALQGFGGVLAVAQREIVERRRWMTREEFIEEWAVAQMLPGPNIVNLSLIMGNRWFGLRGALVAVAGMLAVPALVVLLLALAYAQWGQHPQVTGALRGMGAVAAGLIAATGLKLLAALGHNPLGRTLCGALVFATFVAIALLRVPLALVLLVLGSAGFALAWPRIQP